MKAILHILQSDPPSLQFCNEQFETNKTYSSSFVEFMGCCLLREVEDRMDVNELLELSFIKQRKDNNYLLENVVKYCDLERRIQKDCFPESLIVDDENLNGDIEITKTIGRFKVETIDI